MCSHYTALKKQAQLEKYFRARSIPLPPKSDMCPRYAGPFIRRAPEYDAGDEAVPEGEIIRSSSRIKFGAGSMSHAGGGAGFGHSTAGGPCWTTSRQ